jgi:NAD(P)H-hydrate epimerase
MHTALPEAMVDIDKNADYVTELANIDRYDAIGLGPGIGKADETKELMKRLLTASSAKPLVIDADGLNIMAENNEMLHHLPEGTILTPHPGEFDRLTGNSDSTEEPTTYERIQKARTLASEQKICIILKGAYTAVCTPTGKVYFNTSGNPGMSTAGSGDVLTGILLGLLSQGYRPEEASVIGVYLHGLAGNLAAATLSEESLIAGDIIQMLGTAFRQMHDATS